MKILIIDDQILFAEGLKNLIETNSDSKECLALATFGSGGKKTAGQTETTGRGSG